MNEQWIGTTRPTDPEPQRGTGAPNPSRSAAEASSPVGVPAHNRLDCFDASQTKPNGQK